MLGMLIMTVVTVTSGIHIKCPTLVAPQNGVPLDCAVTEGSPCVISCLPGYVLNPKDTVLTCQTTGTWNLPMPTCDELICSDKDCAPGAKCQIDLQAEQGFICVCDEAQGYYAINPGIHGEKCVVSAVKNTKDGLTLVSGKDVFIQSSEGKSSWNAAMETIGGLVSSSNFLMDRSI